MNIAQIWKSVLALLLVGLIANNANAQQDFTATQEDSIRQIVKDYLITDPSVLREALTELQRSEELERQVASRQQLQKGSDAVFNAPDDPIGGNPEGTITVVEFFDYNCPYCRKAKPVIRRLLSEDPRIRYVFKEFPILAETSQLAAAVALATWQSNPEKYWNLHTKLMGFSGQLTDDDIRGVVSATGLSWDDLIPVATSDRVTEKLEANINLARQLGISGTPTFVIGDEIFPGLVPYETLAKAINTAGQ